MKKLLALVLSLVMMLSLVACGGKTDSKKDNTKDTNNSHSIDNVQNENANTPTDDGTGSDVGNNDTGSSIFESAGQKVTAYLGANESVKNGKEITSVHHARFQVDADEYKKSIDMNDFLSMILMAAFSGLTGGEDALVDMMSKPLRMELPDGFMMMSIDTGAMTIVMNSNSETTDGEGIQDFSALRDASIEEIKQHLDASMESMNSSEETGADDFQFSVGEVFRFEDKIIFEMSMRMNVPDVDATLKDPDTNNLTKTVESSGYGSIVFSDTEAFVGIFLTDQFDTSVMLSCAKSLTIDESVEGISEDEVNKGFFGDGSGLDFGFNLDDIDLGDGIDWNDFD